MFKFILSWNRVKFETFYSFFKIYKTEENNI